MKINKITQAILAVAGIVTLSSCDTTVVAPDPAPAPMTTTETTTETTRIVPSTGATTSTTETMIVR